MKNLQVHNNWKRDWKRYLKPTKITSDSHPPLFRWLFWVYSLDKQEYQKWLYKHRKQTTFIYCPHCDVELLSQNFAYIEHNLKEDPSEYFYCQGCGTLSQWNFDLPCPVLEKTYETNSEQKYNKLEELNYYKNWEEY